MSNQQAPSYQAILLGQAFNREGLSAFTSLEASTAEGAQILVRLDFAEPPSNEAVAQLNQACLSQGVPPWPGNMAVVYRDPVYPSALDLAWVKGQVMWAIIIGIVATTVLPAIMGGVIWLLLPQSVKDMIYTIIDFGMMMLMMWVVMALMKPLMSIGSSSPKQVKAAAPAPREEVQK